MKQLFIKKENTKSLVLVFLGYGQDGRLFKCLEQSSYDVAVVYDYEDLSFDESLYQEYQSINIIAWSMGVMMAPLILDKTNLLSKVIFSAALNGTIEGIDDNYGIPLVMWQATIDAISADNVLKFYRRMCLNKADYDNYLEYKPVRSVESLKNELEKIKEWALLPKVNSFSYDLAIIGNKDRIINPKNQFSSWNIKSSDLIQKDDLAHFSKEQFIKILELCKE